MTIKFLLIPSLLRDIHALWLALLFFEETYIGIQMWWKDPWWAWSGSKGKGQGGLSSEVTRLWYSNVFFSAKGPSARWTRTLVFNGKNALSSDTVTWTIYGSMGNVCLPFSRFHTGQCVFLFTYPSCMCLWLLLSFVSNEYQMIFLIPFILFIFLLRWLSPKANIMEYIPLLTEGITLLQCLRVVTHCKAHEWASDQ